MASFLHGFLDDPGGRTVLITLGILVFVTPLLLSIRQWRQKNQPGAEEIMAHDTRKPVLYLRPFKVDENTFHVGSGKKREDVRAEPLFLEPFNILGPLVAIG